MSYSVTGGESMRLRLSLDSLKEVQSCLFSAYRKNRKVFSDFMQGSALKLSRGGSKEVDSILDALDLPTKVNSILVSTAFKFNLDMFARGSIDGYYNLLDNSLTVVYPPLFSDCCEKVYDLLCECVPNVFNDEDFTVVDMSDTRGTHISSACDELSDYVDDCPTFSSPLFVVLTDSDDYLVTESNKTEKIEEGNDFCEDIYLGCCKLFEDKLGEESKVLVMLTPNLYDFTKVALTKNKKGVYNVVIYN